MMDLVVIVDRAVRAAGIPIHGVCIGDPADRSTWKIVYNQATAGQIAAGDALIQGFNPADPAVVSREAAEAAKQLNDRRVQALAIAVHQRFKRVVPTDTTTPAQWQQALRDAFEALG